MIRRSLAVILLFIFIGLPVAQSQNLNILSALPSVPSVNGTDLFYDVQIPGLGGVKVTANQIKTFVSAGIVGTSDLWTDASTIGVDCTGVADSTSAIQTWVNAHLNGGHLMFPFGCQVKISSTITITDGINLTFSSASPPGQGPAATLIWNGTNGGNNCSSAFSSCVYMFDLEHTDHPTFERLAFSANEANSGWQGDTCPDGFLKFDGNPVTHIGTAGHVIEDTFVNNCVNPNFVAVNISQTSVDNHENYYLFDNIITCSVKAAGQLSHDGVSNGTTTLTAASGPFAANNVGRRIRISHAGGEFETTVAAFVSSTQVTLAVAVPWSDSAQTLFIDQGYGVGIRIGANQNSLQHVAYKLITSFCEVGYEQVGGNSSINQPTGISDDFGTFIGPFTAQNTYLDYGAAENNYVDTYVGSGITTPVSVSHMRWSNGNQSAVGYVALGSQVRITDSFTDFGPQSANSNFLTPPFTYKVNSIGTVVGGSGYTAGTYTGVPLLFTTGVPTPTVTGAGADYGVKGTVVISGGAVTSVTITTAGTFLNFPLPMTSGFIGGSNIVTYSLTAAPANIGGTGTGFSVPVTSLVTNTITGNANIFSANNNWSVGGWTYSEIGFPNLGNNLVTLSDVWDNVTQPAGNQIVCGGGGSSITGVDTCNKITQNINGGLGMDVLTGTNTSGSGPAIGYRSEGTFSGASNTSFTGFQNLPTTGRMSQYYAGFENAAVAIDATNSPSASYGFISRQMTSYSTTIPNVYGFYAEGQKITNVTAGWGFYSAGASDKNFMAGNLMLGNNGLTVPAAGFGLAKIAADGVAPGAAGGKIELVCGTNAGTAKLIAYAGTSSTPVTILDNIGSGVTGC